jgi:hypothetical protein
MVICLGYSCSFIEDGLLASEKDHIGVNLAPVEAAYAVLGKMLR